jgi:hypothetical protein
VATLLPDLASGSKTGVACSHADTRGAGEGATGLVVGLEEEERGRLRATDEARGRRQQRCGNERSLLSGPKCTALSLSLSRIRVEPFT